MRRLAGLWLLLLAAGFAGQPAAHELQPSSFELRQLTPERYEIIWRAPTYYRKPHPARLQLPENWQPAGAAKVTRLADGALHRRLVDIPPDTVDGAIIRFGFDDQIAEPQGSQRRLLGRLQYAGASGRERGARQLGEPGDIYFWVEDDRIMIVFGRTPISRPGEMRLPRPCNLWARALEDVGVLKAVRPGEKVTVTPAED